MIKGGSRSKMPTFRIIKLLVFNYTSGRSYHRGFLVSYHTPNYTVQIWIMDNLTLIYGFANCNQQQQQQQHQMYDNVQVEDTKRQVVADV